MKERPIIFSGEMVRAILDGRKTMTRRVVKNVCDIVQDWDKNDKSYGPFFEDEYGDSHKTIELYPYGLPGDRLWVRESFWLVDSPYSPDWPQLLYEDEFEKYQDYDWVKGQSDEFWSSRLWEYYIKKQPAYGHKPSIHMPRWASRITLEITDVRVERVQEISIGDAFAEGVMGYERGDGPWEDPFAVPTFRDTWNSINEKRGYGWEVNPWVWVIEFKQIKEES